MELTMAMTDQAPVADIQVALGNAKWLHEHCPRCGSKPIVHDYEDSEDWCPVCGHSEMWSDEQ